LKIQNTKPPILYVEDDRVLNHLVKIYFRDSYETIGVFNAKSALEKLPLYTFRFFLLDINLGEGMNGIDLLKQIKKIPGYEKTPVIAVTAYALEGDREYLLSSGFDGYIPKPFTKKQLLDYMEEFSIHKKNTDIKIS